MRLTSTLLFATALALASAGALANRPVTTLPSGAVVDLDTGVVTTPTGTHYTLSTARLRALRERLTHGVNTTLAPSSATEISGGRNDGDRQQQGQPPQ
ncbi:MAG: hypothetical protein WCB49_07235 [Gammaproteobacteria bacterium]